MIVNIVIILFALTLLYMAVTSRLESIIKMLSIQGFLLFIIAIFSTSEKQMLELAILIFETLGIKMIVIPLYLRKVIRENEIYRETEVYISNFYSLLIVTLFITFSFILAYKFFTFAEVIKPLHFGMFVSIVFTAFFFIITRKKLITHIMGYILLENGIFMLSLSIAKSMPIIVDLGISLDLFMAVFLAGVFIKRIQYDFDDLTIDKLTDLKD